MRIGMTPGEGRLGEMVLDGEPLSLVPGTYVNDSPDRFGEKLSLGDLKYADFNPYETGWPVSSWHGGYGLRRYSDIQDQYVSWSNVWHPAAGGSAITMYLEADGVECGENGVAYLSPLQIHEVLNKSGWVTPGPPVWIGEFNNKLVCVAGDAIFDRDTTAHPDVGTWTKQADLHTTAVRGAVAVFGGNLLIGYGSAGIAEYFDTAYTAAHAQTTVGGAGDIYVWAAVADRAAVYVAGGKLTTDVNIVRNGTTMTTLDGAVTCGSSHSEITSLSPGGRIVEVFVGKETELGCIDSDGKYKILVPFDTETSNNARGMRWWLGAGGAEQRGPVIVYFPRDRTLWSYSPSTELAGTAENVSPWGLPGIRPLNAMGNVVAIQGSARWLYYVVRNVDGDSWVLRRDSRTGVTHNYLNVGAVTDCYALNITSLFGTNPLLFFGKGTDISYVILPVDGESPLSDSATRFCASGTLTLPDADLFFPDEQKILFSERVIGDGLSANQAIKVEYVLDGGAWTYISGSASSSTVAAGPSAEIAYPANTTCKRWGKRYTLSTTSSTSTPQLRGAVTRTFLNTRILQRWTFDATSPGSLLKNGMEDIDEAYPTRRTFRNDWKGGIPVLFTDVDGDQWYVRITKMLVRQVSDEPNRQPVWVISLQLLETRRVGSAGVLLWDSDFVWDSPYNVWP